MDLNRLGPGLLHAFLVVADAGKISEAARRLHLSQPAVTAQIRRLEADLDMAEARLPQRRRPSGAEADPARDQVGVEPTAGAFRYELFEVGSEKGLAPAQVQVEDAKRSGLTDHAPPLEAVQLRIPLDQSERIRAVDASQWAGVGELGNQ